MGNLGKNEEHERGRLRRSIYRVEAGLRRSRGPEWRPGRGVRRRRGVLLCVDGGEEGDDASPSISTRRGTWATLGCAAGLGLASGGLCWWTWPNR